MEEAILSLSDEEAEWVLRLSDDLFWQYMKERENAQVPALR